MAARKPMAYIHIDNAQFNFDPGILVALNRIEGKVDSILADIDDFRDLLGRLNAATTDIAGDVKALMDLISTSMSADQVAEVKSGLSDAVAALEAAASEFPPPVG